MWVEVSELPDALKTVGEVWGERPELLLFVVCMSFAIGAGCIWFVASLQRKAREIKDFIVNDPPLEVIPPRQFDGGAGRAPMHQISGRLEASSAPRRSGPKRPMLLGFVLVVIVAHYLGVWGTILLPLGFGVVMWLTNRQGWTLKECLAFVGFIVFSAMIGLWSLIIFVPIILLMSKMTKD